MAETLSRAEMGAWQARIEARTSLATSFGPNVSVMGVLVSYAAPDLPDAQVPVMVLRAAFETLARVPEVVLTVLPAIPASVAPPVPTPLPCPLSRQCYKPKFGLQDKPNSPLVSFPPPAVPRRAR